MQEILKKYLFTKSILVSDSGENQLETLFALANKFAIRITQGKDRANGQLIPFVGEMLGQDVPQAFYKGFPQSVRKLSPDKLLFDQLVHYTVTYGFGDFSQPGHSVMEENFERLAFKEDVEIRDFTILSEEEAAATLAQIVADMLKGTRPLGNMQYEVLKAYIGVYGCKIEYCACKDTAIKLLLDTRDSYYARFISLSDVIKLVDALNYGEYGNTNLKKLNLKNKDRKFISFVINYIFEKGNCNVKECFERKALWCGLLHHIHFKAATEQCDSFVRLMRGKGNQSAYSSFEAAMAVRNIKEAVVCLNESKGSGAVLRKMNYILSRCRTEEELQFVINSVDTKNAVILIQLLIQYANYRRQGSRIFKFTRYNRLKIHEETAEEVSKRRSLLDEKTVETINNRLYENLKELLHGRAGKVYISKNMYNIALPLQENTANGGYGVLAKGSRIHIEEGKKVRAFIYWEKVNDIDLSVIGIREDSTVEEYSWRTMYRRQSDYITFSGDETSGYKGGVEYFDVDIARFKKANPDIRYLVFNGNVFTGISFSKCICRAGYMLRDVHDSGEAFEAKTVKSSFTVDCDSTFSHLFGIDIATNDFVWLNIANNRAVRVAGNTRFDFMEDYFAMTSVINVGTLFEMLAAEVTDAADQADVVVADENLPAKEGALIVHSYDFEKINAYICGN